MPRRVVSSITHDIEYDRFWTDEWHAGGVSPTGYVPIQQSLRAFRQNRIMPEFNVPMSLEFINVLTMGINPSPSGSLLSCYNVGYGKLPNQFT